MWLLWIKEWREDLHPHGKSSNIWSYETEWIKKKKKGQNAQMIHHFKPIFEQMRIWNITVVWKTNYSTRILTSRIMGLSFKKQVDHLWLSRLFKLLAGYKEPCLKGHRRWNRISLIPSPLRRFGKETKWGWICLIWLMTIEILSSYPWQHGQSGRVRETDQDQVCSF